MRPLGRRDPGWVGEPSTNTMTVTLPLSTTVSFREDPVIFQAETGPLSPGQRSRKVSVRREALPPLADLVPKAIADIVRASRLPRGIPLAHEFVRSIVERRPPALDVLTAANWTAAGVCAHQSAMQGGMRVNVLQYI